MELVGPHWKIAKAEWSDKVRPVLERRDGNGCRACGAAGELQVAHITSLRAFCFQLGWNAASVAASYRLDNVLLLCKPCHGAQTLGANRIDWTAATLAKASRDSFEWNCAANRFGRWGIKCAEDAHQRRRDVVSLFGKLQRRRGWLSAIDLVRGLTWDGKPLPEKVLAGASVARPTARPVTVWM
jgi:hypothetical protein